MWWWPALPHTLLGSLRGTFIAVGCWVNICTQDFMCLSPISLLSFCYSSQLSDNQCICLEASHAGPNHSSLHLRLLSSDLSSSSLTSGSIYSDGTGFWACLPMSGQLDLQKSNLFGWFSGFTSASLSCPAFKLSLGCCGLIGCPQHRPSCLFWNSIFSNRALFQDNPPIHPVEKGTS